MLVWVNGQRIRVYPEEAELIQHVLSVPADHEETRRQICEVLRLPAFRPYGRSNFRLIGTEIVIQEDGKEPFRAYSSYYCGGCMMPDPPTDLRECPKCKVRKLPNYGVRRA